MWQRCAIFINLGHPARVKLLTFRKGDVAKVGLWKNGKVLDLPEALAPIF